ncbi:hypothetical protein [Haloarcula laminariae]|nr:MULTISPECIES: hypothetical protein [Halomicroarcula]
MSADGTDDTSDRPEFRGCLFCYAGEWAYYGAKTAVGKVSDSQSSQ